MRSPDRSLFLGSLLALALSACTPDPVLDGGVDASAIDAGTRDAGRDAGRDGGARDAGTDAAARDASADAAARDAGLDAGLDAAARDAALDAMLDAGTDAGPIVLPCLGDTRAMTLSRGLPFATVSVGASPAPSGLFLVDLATTASVIDMAAFSPRPAATGCDPTRLGQLCRFADLDFFGSWGSVTLVTQDLRGLGGVSQAGIVGTDFTSVLAITLDYELREIRAAQAATLCSDATLRSAGFVALSTEGFYSNVLSTLRPMTEVDPSASPGSRVPNVPTVPIRVAGTSALAQLDSGFDDTLVPRSVNVNTALFDAVVAADPGALVRNPPNDLALTTCVVGVTENVDAYTLAPGRVLELVVSDGSLITLTGVNLFVKRTPPAARVCGGIGTWTAPAAQIAASLHVALGRVLADPFSSRVWVPRP